MSSALEWEKQETKKEAEKALLPVWMIRKLTDGLSGKKNDISLSELLEQASNAEKPKKPSTPLKSAEEIIAEFMPMIEAERRRLKHG